MTSGAGLRRRRVPVNPAPPSAGERHGPSSEGAKGLARVPKTQVGRSVSQNPQRYKSQAISYEVAMCEALQDLSVDFFADDTAPTAFLMAEAQLYAQAFDGVIAAAPQHAALLRQIKAFYDRVCGQQLEDRLSTMQKHLRHAEQQVATQQQLVQLLQARQAAQDLEAETLKRQLQQAEARLLEFIDSHKLSLVDGTIHAIRAITARLAKQADALAETIEAEVGKGTNSTAPSPQVAGLVQAASQCQRTAQRLAGRVDALVAQLQTFAALPRLSRPQAAVPVVAGLRELQQLIDFAAHGVDIGSDDDDAAAPPASESPPAGADPAAPSPPSAATPDRRPPPPPPPPRVPTMDKAVQVWPMAPVNGDVIFSPRLSRRPLAHRWRHKRTFVMGEEPSSPQLSPKHSTTPRADFLWLSSMSRGAPSSEGPPTPHLSPTARMQRQPGDALTPKETLRQRRNMLQLYSGGALRSVRDDPPLARPGMSVDDAPSSAGSSPRDLRHRRSTLGRVLRGMADPGPSPPPSPPRAPGSAAPSPKGETAVTGSILLDFMRKGPASVDLDESLDD